MPVALRIVNQFFPKVKKIVDAKGDETVRITSKDVASAKRKDHSGCVFAEACKRELKVEGALFSTRTAFLVKGDTAVRFRVPERVHREIQTYDRGGEMSLTEYELHEPDSRPLGEKARKTGRGHSPGPSRTKHVRHPHAEGVRATLLELLPKGKIRSKRKR